MYTIVRSKRYERDFRKFYRSGRFDVRILDKVVNKLARSEILEAKYRDHKLGGPLSGYRECHVMPDLLLIYEKIDDVMILHLIRLGSHGDLF